MGRRMCKPRLGQCIGCLLILIVIIMLIILMISTNFSNRTQVIEVTLESFNQLANKDDFLHHIEDMQRLQKSIIGELSQLEQKRNKMKSSVKLLEDSNKDFDMQSIEMERKIAQLKADVRNMLVTKTEIFDSYASAHLPLPVLPDSANFVHDTPKSDCRLEKCFDYSRCSVVSGFPVYLYPIHTDDNILISWKTAITNSPYITSNPVNACIYLVLFDGSSLDFQSLPYWRGDGRNHVIINVVSKSLVLPKSRTMLAQFSFNNTAPVFGFDILLPYVNLQPLDYSYLPLLLPVRRKNLASFYGSAPAESNDAEMDFINAMNNLYSSSTLINFTTSCVKDPECNSNHWCLCSDNKNINIERNSTFIVIPNSASIPSEQFVFRIHMALVNGAIPVILGHYHQLPLAGFISWDDAVVMLPMQRVTELEFILRNILEPDIMSYKKQGRLILDNYLLSISKVANALINTLRSRINIPPLHAPILESSLVYGEQNQMPTFQARVDHANEILGPIETPFSSPAYQRNFTSSLRRSQEHHWSLSSYLFPHTPWDPILPTDAKYHGSSYGFRPINGGAGGSGKEFSESLGGNYPREQYTIVILTYDRSELLQQQLAQFNGLPYLNKVLVIWNNPLDPPPNLQWPLIHVPIQVIKAERNSLNNRFLPFKEIETEAILSMDDDMYLRHDEILFAFRVWRESRDRIVGFPGRYHAWNMHDGRWNYNSNHSCELSMILTGAAFFHKYYMYQYSYFMPKAIREKVDEFMNCEDLAMNFLVSHITGKPPIKTTSRWTFRCPTCGETALWIDESHFNERHKCIEFFTQVYGYLPLMYTQFRADSVLFKTRVPEDKSKCFILV